MAKKKQAKAETQRRTALQELFCQHYATNGCNGTRAAESAGYTGSENTLASTASRLLRNDKIKARIKEIFEEHLQGLFLDSNRVLIMAYENRKFALEGEPIVDKEGSVVGYRRNIPGANQATRMIGDHKSVQAFVKEDGDDKSKESISEININVIGLDRALT